MEDSSNLIISRLMADDETAIVDLSREYGEELGLVIVSITRSKELAEDALQDTLIAIWNQRDRLGEVQNFRSYLRTIARRRAIDLVRKEASRRVIEGAAAESEFIITPFYSNAGANKVDSQDFSWQVHGVLKTLPKRCREIFLMHWVGGLSYGEIADTLEIARETVHKQMYRAMKEISARFKKI